MKEQSTSSNSKMMGLVLVLIVALVPVASLAEGPSATEVAGAVESAAGGGSADWWPTVQAQIRSSEYHVTWQDRTYLADVEAAFQAPNREQNLRIYFMPQGVAIIPRVCSNFFFAALASSQLLNFPNRTRYQVPRPRRTTLITNGLRPSPANCRTN